MEEMSAVLNLPNETSVPVNGNHRTICRFSNSPAEMKRFEVVQSHLQEMADKLLGTEIAEVSHKRGEFWGC